MYLVTSDSVLFLCPIGPHPEQWPQVNDIEHTSVPPAPTEMSMQIFRFESVTILAEYATRTWLLACMNDLNARIYGFSNLLTR